MPIFTYSVEPYRCKYSLPTVNGCIIINMEYKISKQRGMINLIRMTYAVGIGVIGITLYTLSLFQESSVVKQVYFHVATGLFLSMAIVLSSPIAI